MKIYTKLRWMYLVFSLSPLALILWLGYQTRLEQDPLFNQLMASGIIAALFIAFTGPWITQQWIFLHQIKRIEKFCRNIKEGEYETTLPVPNESRDKDEDNEMVNLMRDLNWMAHRIGNREKELQRSINELSESHREIREKSLHLEQANSSLKLAQMQLQTQKTELEQAFAQMHLLAMTDALTQIANRRSFFDSFHHILTLAQREKRPVSLLMLDIDHFKQINDQYGHQAGDWVLIELASRLRACIRHSDIAARIGGEEFALLLPETDYSGASTIANRIYAAINQQAFELPENPGTQVTASLGMCSLNPNSPYPALDVFVHYADQALYCCKQEGRNGICRYDPTSHLINKIAPAAFQPYITRSKTN
ncbi:MAG: diguanylate cyclase [Anaerosporomusa subterranea]|jgi:diguanylate cyclase (GGDEF)-like protein|nr:diguanylate cyclase [Anaerosporomusa subterranea]